MPPAADPATVPVMDTNMIDLNGHETRLLTRGDDGPAILFLHGFPEHAGGWAPVMDALDGHRCFAPDQRGYGWSHRPQAVEEYQTGHLVKDMLDLIGVLGLDRVHVVGHDWGAAVAYGVAFANDPRVASLTIANGVHPVPFQREIATGGPQCAASQYMNWLRRPDSHEILAADDFERLIGFFKKGMNMDWLSGAVLDEYRRVWQGPEVLSAMVNWYRASPIVIGPPGEELPPEKLPPFKPEYMKVRVPHLLIWGLGDTALLAECQNGLEEFCAELAIHEFPDADHWIVHQKPAEVAALIRDHIAKVDG